jgi:hypothetical protein
LIQAVDVQHLELILIRTMLLLQLHGPLLCDASLLTQILTVLRAPLLLLGNPHLLLWLRQLRLAPLLLCRQWRLCRRALRISILVVVLMVFRFPLLLLIVVLLVVLPLNACRQTRPSYR